jgi:hypothetical protein
LAAFVVSTTEARWTEDDVTALIGRDADVQRFDVKDTSSDVST